MTRLRTTAIILVALFGVLVLASAVADRLGAAIGITSTLMLTLGCLSLATAALLAGSTRGPVFQSAVETRSGPLAAALVALCLGLSCLPGDLPPTVKAAPALSLAFALLVQGLVMPQSPVNLPDQSFGDFIARRFGSRLLAALACLAGAGLLAGLGIALGERSTRIMAHVTGIVPGTARWLVLVFTLLLVIPGGARSVVTAAVVALAIAIVGWSAAAGPSLLRQDWTSIVQAEAALDAVLVASPTLAGWAVAAGLMTLLHLPIVGTSSEQNRRGYAWAALFVIAATGLSVAAVAAPGMTVPIPPVLQAITALAPVLLLPVAFAMVVHVLSRTLVRDVLYRLTGRQGTASGRMALQRFVALLMAGWFTLSPPPLPALDSPVGRVALLLAAAVPLPLMLLSRWQRVDWRAATCGIVAALIAAGALAAGLLETPLALAGGALSCLTAGILAATLFPPGPQLAARADLVEQAA